MWIFNLILILFTLNANGDGVKNWQFGMQQPASPVMEELHNFHHFLLIIVTFIVLVVALLLIYVCFKFNAKRNPIPSKRTENIIVEVAWTVIPAIILVIIAVPSFRILNFMEKIPPAELTIKVVGNQWYWHYIYPDEGNFEYDSYIVGGNDLGVGQHRLLTVDNNIVVPENTVIKFLITAADVIHSFAIPALGIKTDAIPGRVNETWTKVTRTGKFYGQCSEICGVNHGFMPIVIEVVSKEDFANWLIQAKTKFGSINSPRIYSPLSPNLNEFVSYRIKQIIK